MAQPDAPESNQTPASPGGSGRRRWPRRPHWRSVPPMRYPDAYLWFILFAAMDIMLTWKILLNNGSELNPVARLILYSWNEFIGADDWVGALWASIVFKFALVMFVIVVCEILGRRKDRSGRVLAWVAVVVSATPVLYSISLLFYHTYFTGGITSTP
jgi:hypothetical protein